MGKTERMTNGTTGGPVFVYVQDGKIIRVTPMDLDETDASSWQIKARGETFMPPRKTTLAPFSFYPLLRWYGYHHHTSQGVANTLGMLPALL